MSNVIAETDLVRVDERPSAEAGEFLQSVDLDLIPTGVRLDYPLFIQIGDESHRRFTLVKNVSAPLTDRVKRQIRWDNTPVFTKAKYFQTYEKSIEENFENVLTNESVPIEKRASALYQKGEGIMEAFFQRPDSKENYIKAQGLVGNIVRLTHSNEKGAQSMMKLAKRDYNTYTHSLHVCILGVGFSQRLLTDEELMRKRPIHTDIEKLGQGFIYHDLGKTQVDPKILKKNGPLNAREWQEIQRHPLDGAQLLGEMGIRDKEIHQITLYHHERMDGKGYPYGLQGEEIPVIARVAAITDAFDAITSRRAYKEAESTFQALSIMKNENAGFYDSELFKHFILMFQKKQEK